MKYAFSPDTETRPKTRLRVLGPLLLIAALSGCQWLPQQWPWQDAPSQDPTTVQRRADIKHLLDKGELAFNKDRLSIPAEDNAVLYYRQVLQLDPDNLTAKTGLNKVAKRYCDLAITAHGNGDKRLAQKYLRRAEEAGGSSADIQKLHQQFQDVPAGGDPRALRVDMPSSATVKQKSAPILPKAAGKSDKP